MASGAAWASAHVGAVNDSASVIGQHIDGQVSIADIIKKVKAMFGDIPEIEQDIIEYMLVAQREHWIDLV